MSLYSRCAQEFLRSELSIGRRFFLQGKVEPRNPTPEEFEFRIHESDRQVYLVQIDFSQAKEGKLPVTCNCGIYESIGPCRHIAGAIWFADSIKLEVLGSGRLKLETPFTSPRHQKSSPSTPGLPSTFSGPFVRFTRSSQDQSQEGNLGRSASLPGPFVRFTRSTQDQPPAWKKALDGMRKPVDPEVQSDWSESFQKPPAPDQIWFAIDLQRMKYKDQPCITLYQRAQKKDGTLGKFLNSRLSRREIPEIQPAEDRRLIELLVGNEQDSGLGFSFGGYDPFLHSFILTPSLFDILLPLLCSTGRFGWFSPEAATPDQQFQPVSWEDGPPWVFQLTLGLNQKKTDWIVEGWLEKEGKRLDIQAPRFYLESGIIFFQDKIGRWDSQDSMVWLKYLLKHPPLEIPFDQGKDLVEQLTRFPNFPRIQIPQELVSKVQVGTPQPRLTIAQSRDRVWDRNLDCRLQFRYGETVFGAASGLSACYDRDQMLLIHRNPQREKELWEELTKTDVKIPRPGGIYESGVLQVLPEKMNGVVSSLCASGWEVVAEGSRVRSAGSFQFKITTGVDWFDLEAEWDFGGARTNLPSLLEALKNGQSLVRLDDGTQGILPEEWLRRFGGLAQMGKAQDNRIRFLSSQALLLDALLAAQDQDRVRIDRAFRSIRDKLRSFEGIAPGKEPKTFQGELRPYQREGLGWIEFLDSFGFGGCLADDMGLGKTVQVLAHLENARGKKRRKQSSQVSPKTKSPLAGKSSPASLKPQPSLVVVPKSLVFNWIEEAARFTPTLKVLNHTGNERHLDPEKLQDYDLVVTTYGILRRDILKLQEVTFDWAILDEAQAIKTASSQSAKACRLIQSRRRLAMTGTPLENHLGELWSIFEFLNPGMLGTNNKLGSLFSPKKKSLEPETTGTELPPVEQLDILSRALRPFLLRRTKDQVLADLPEKTEQTLLCELSKEERRLYDELKSHYRNSLLGQVRDRGMKSSQIQVLEALLRLRQAACHPGLLDYHKKNKDSAKLEILLEQLKEVREGGHKALVFSQFTTFLGIVRQRLDDHNIPYEYLDGKSSNRKEKVERFQTDPECPYFLISLKAGGVGLNLTAADYIFILDPWWNPAVEAQAIDRAHRIGQNKRVFAYRLIAKDTVEDKILQLQSHKRNLAEAILTANQGPLADLTAEDLGLLLS